MERDARKDDSLLRCDTGARKRRKANAASQINSNGLANTYLRQRDLPRLIALWPHEINDMTASGTHKLIARLRCALRAERRRGHAGHWSYDLDRHLGLVKAYKCEIAALENRTIAAEN